MTTCWVKTSRGWEGAEGELRLQGWSRSRRVVVLRRLKAPVAAPRPVLAEAAAPSMPWTEVVAAMPEYEHIVLVTNLKNDLVTLTGLSLFLSGLRDTAAQLSPRQCWERIWDRILAPLLSPNAALPVPSG